MYVNIEKSILNYTWLKKVHQNNSYLYNIVIKYTFHFEQYKIITLE